jgi:formylglycine-generating enzyme required for sulfatase activity
MATKGEKYERLRDFLNNSFRPFELDMFLKVKGFAEVAETVARSVGGVEYTFGIVEALDHRGLIDAQFFDHLAKERPGLKGLIKSLEAFWLETGDETRTVVVPKGLQSFDANDAQFFLELLPGPRDENGLPESIRFWKHRIEARDELAFTVGVIFGPSGCGKSSLVKAGLLPRLADGVVSIYVEATDEDTEARLLKGLRKRFPDLPGDLDLTGTIAAVQQGQGLGGGQKLLVVLDQFEQWLHARRREQDPELGRALRQCDGERVQGLIMVRDDFWVALTRFLGKLPIDILQGRNAALVDLFDPIHARKVLAEFGRAYRRLPEDDRALTNDQESFLTQTIEGLRDQDGRVSPVRLAVFVEMVKGRPWSPATLKEIGGTQGVGFAFLEQTFSSIPLKAHRKAAQGLLKALLPEIGTTIKGGMRSHDDLVAASGYASRRSDLDNLLWTLEHSVRLITPTDPEGTETEGGGQPAPEGRYYQLTHDYLVPSIREWLTREQQKTRRGRAELRLTERAGLWNAKPENRHLPSVWEWANIRLLTKSSEWTAPQRRMMRRADRVKSLTILGLATLIALAIWVIVDQRASTLVESLQTTQSTRDVPPIIEHISTYRLWANHRLRRMLRDSDDQSPNHLHASLALLEVDPSQVDFLSNRLRSATPTELPVIREFLARYGYGTRLAPNLWSELDAAQPGDDRLLRPAGALARFDVENRRWTDLGGKVAEALVTVNSLDVGPWLEALRPVGGKLKDPLWKIFVKNPSETVRSQAMDFLAEYAKDDPVLLAELFLVSDPKAYASHFRVLEQRSESVLPVFQAELTKGPATSEKETATEQAKDELAERQARAAVALIRLGHAEEVRPRLQHSRDPEHRSFLVNRLSLLGADPRILASELDHIPANGKPAPAKGQQFMDAVLFHPETSQRRALILALGTYGTQGLSPGEREPLIAKLLDLYEHDPDAGIHGAAEWTLRQWEEQAKLEEIDARLRGKDQRDHRWYVNRRGQTFVIIEGPVKFSMGSPPAEPQQTIPRCFAIATKEVTLAQYQEFAREYPQFALSEASIKEEGLEPDRAMTGVSWYIATAYCNWLSEREGIHDKDQWCYLPNKKGEYGTGMTIPANALQRQGYRLPTEAEWEYACRAGTLTSRYYGSAEVLLKHYAWYEKNSGQPNRVQPCGRMLPNDVGLFDLMGNAWEWCQDRYIVNPGKANTSIGDIIDDASRVLRGGSFSFSPAFLRSAYSNWDAPASRYRNNGFRLARTYN